MGQRVAVGKLSDIPPGGCAVVTVGKKDIAVFNADGKFFAIDDTCPHQGASLGEGILHEGTVICPWHAWTFSLRTGESPIAPELSVACYPTRLAGESVEVEVPEETA